MEHKWTSYHGFTESFEYCEMCDQRKGKHDYNCSTTVASTPQMQRREDTHVFYDINYLLASDDIQSSCSGGGSQNRWTYYHTFSAEDHTTKLEFENGDILSPKEICAHHNTGTRNYFVDKEFRFVRIRESWKHRKGLTADEYYDDSAEISTPIGTVSPRIGFGNSNAGNQTGTQHGQQSSSGLGTIPHSLANWNALAEEAEEFKQRIYGRLVQTDNDSED